MDKIPKEEKKKINECENESIILIYDIFHLRKGTLLSMIPKFPKGTLKKYFLRSLSYE